MTTIHIQTPLWESPTISAAFGGPVLLKMEALQPTGSFKARGIGFACQQAAAAGARRLVSSSGGNAGLAVAYAARKLGLPATVVVPRSTSERARQLIRQEGAGLIEHGASWDNAHAYAVGLATAADTAYIHPFDDPLVWQGHATLIHEVAAAGVKPGAVAVSVGGGGLLIGLLQGLAGVGWADLPVLAVETRGADSLARSLAAGRLVTLDAITSLATTLGARTVAAEALRQARQHNVTSWVVSDRQAVEACLRFADDHRLLVEPACGAALAAGYEPAGPLNDLDGPLLIVVCGGAGVNRSLLADWDERTATN